MGGDIRGTFAVVKKMKGFQVRPKKTVLLKDGTVASDENARQARWQDHFCEVLCGRIVEDRQALITIPTYTSENRGCVDVSPERFLRKFTRMNPHKGWAQTVFQHRF